ncbi:MAG: glycosyltransferase family 9 protein [Syntrophobacterales bacterium]|nr:glycosyltransferase family 9 protein [Syntrophobacterales bacterium]
MFKPPLMSSEIAKTYSYGHVLFLKKLDYLARSIISSPLGKVFGLGHRSGSIQRIGSNRGGKILVIRPGGIGDAVLLIPVLNTLRNQYPKSSITVLSERRNVSVFRPLVGSVIDELLCYDNLRDFLRIIMRSFDVIIDSEQWHVLSALLTSFLAKKGGITIGFATDDRANLFSHPVPYDDDGFEGDNFFRLLEPLEIKVKPPRPYSRFYPILKEPVTSNSKRVVLFPGASIKERQWPPENFREVAKRLRAKNVSVVVIGGKEDVELSEAITGGIKGVENLSGKTSLEGTAHILASADLLLSSDSGIMHLALSVGTPVVALFGPGIESKWAPRDNKSVVINRRLPCSPCTRYGYTAVCPQNARCIKEITVDEVMFQIERILFWQDILHDEK